MLAQKGLDLQLPSCVTFPSNSAIGFDAAAAVTIPVPTVCLSDSVPPFSNLHLVGHG